MTDKPHPTSAFDNFRKQYPDENRDFAVETLDLRQSSGELSLTSLKNILKRFGVYIYGAPYSEHVYFFSTAILTEEQVKDLSEAHRVLTEAKSL